MDDQGQQRYDYAMRHGVPQLMDDICSRLIYQRPNEPYGSIIRFLKAKQDGGYAGGAALAGTNVGGGWLRIFSDDGTLRGSVDRLPLNSESELQLMASCSATGRVFLAGVADGGTLLGPNTVVRSFSQQTGELLATYDFQSPIACIEVDQRRQHLWVLFTQGGGQIVQCHNGSRLREIQLPSVSALLLLYEQSDQGLNTTVLWLLTPKAIEKRDADTLQIDLTIHLPDSMLRPTSFIASKTHVWCSSANADGTSNFSGAFERSTGRAAPSIIPPSVSVIAPDTQRRGTWHMAQHSTNGQLVFMNERGGRIMTSELGKWRKANMCIDKGSGFLWLYKDEDEPGKGCRCVLYDPYQQQVIQEHNVPEVEGHTTMLIPL